MKRQQNIKEEGGEGRGGGGVGYKAHWAGAKNREIQYRKKERRRKKGE